MRKLALVAVFSAFVVALLAAPALAQRDPFKPLVVPGSSNQGNTNGQAQEPNEVAPNAPAPSEQLANTGNNSNFWLEDGIVLIAFGGMVLVAARTLRRHPSR
jgi:hypothetical protein